MRLLPGLVLVVLLAAAGCVEPTNVEASNSPEKEEDLVASRGADADETADDGEQTAQPTAQSPADPEGDATAEGPVEISRVPIAHAGVLEPSAFVCVVDGGSGQCVGAGGSGADWLEVAAAGELRALRVTVTWSSSSPATDSLNVDIYLGSDEEGGYLHAYGASPLVLESSEPIVVDGARISVSLPVYGVGVAGDGGFVRPGVADQPFTIEGEIELVSTA